MTGGSDRKSQKNRVLNDPWERLKQYTDARIAIGRSGSSLPTREVLGFALAHARARDAVHTRFDADAVEQGLNALGLQTIRVKSRAADRAEYLTRPDFGRRLLPEDADRLAALDGKPCDIALVVADGLSSAAIGENAVSFISALLHELKESRFTIGTVAIVENGRVAIADEIAAHLHARLVVMAIGERPGLSSADSLGAYLTFAPKVGRSDAERNCISNIRKDGLKLPVAAGKAAWLIREAMRRGLTGVNLKEETGRFLSDR
ncbi:ethanolamine ammonia-lyase subunit EutC [Martelella sp. HB161492]|uniref:ethanolamine ammonia-lyase subunit EutC n=1 Tax=Martelella sp. HB161492 TaxID=2720726 RepID=UPI001590FD88|nr:ethanolamine ammonia-lyase subunit EutC [Martelella sp. HB161492]